MNWEGLDVSILGPAFVAGLLVYQPMYRWDRKCYAVALSLLI